MNEDYCRGSAEILHILNFTATQALEVPVHRLLGQQTATCERVRVRSRDSRARVSSSLFLQLIAVYQNSMILRFCYHGIHSRSKVGPVNRIEAHPYQNWQYG